MTHGKVDYSDVQGLVRFGYGRMTKASYALVRIANVAAARGWLNSAPVTNAVETHTCPSTALQIAFTSSGLRALGIPETVLAGFSLPFRTGMTQENRARQLGDVAANAPEYWEWGGPGREPHLLVMFFGKPDDFEAFFDNLTGDPWREAFSEIQWLHTEASSDGGTFEPFGFRDGISQPLIDWDQQRQTPCVQYDYTNIAALGEFLLGYRNEYGKITDRPLMVPDATNTELLAAVDARDKKDLGRNGTYLVMRQLEQDVQGFWRFVYQQSDGNEAAAEDLAAAMVGRRRNGDPLVPIQDQPIPGIKPTQKQQNQFTYQQDPSGGRCPFGAHARRANPRNTDFPDRPPNLLRKILTMLGFGPQGFRDDLMSSVRFHRIVRRGREYGPPLKPDDAPAPASAGQIKRGLVFICLNANIARQFEFVQNAWIASSKFSGLTEESDPLLGNRQAQPACPITSYFTRQRDGGLRQRVTDLPQFVTVRGGAYFFLPSLRALRYLASSRDV